MQIVKDYIERSMLHDLDIVQHLITKLPESAWVWRPKEGMRSTTELLQYLSFIGAANLQTYIDGGWLPENLVHLRAAREATASLTPADFHGALEDQKNKIKAIFADLSLDDLSTKTTIEPWGVESPLLYVLLNSTLKYLAAYRMQVFLYAKMNGAEIGTLNNWRGIDPPPKQG